MTRELVKGRHVPAASIDAADAVILAVMPSIPVGGMERANIEIFRLLKERGARMVVVTQDGYGNRVEELCRIHGLETIPVSVHCNPRVPRSPFGILQYLIDWIRFVRKIARSYHGVHPHWLYITNLTYFLHSWPILVFSRCRVVFTLPIPPDAPPNRLKAMLVRLMWRRLVTPFCAEIVCNSHFTLNRLLATGAKPKSVQVVYNTLPHRNPARSTTTLLDRAEGRLIVTYIGRLTPAKGISELFEVAVQIVRERSDVDFFFAGDYRWENPFAMELFDRVKDSVLRDRICFLGEIDDVLDLLSKSDLHVLFSVEEAFGLVVLEAKSQGVPSIVSSGGALPELVSHTEDGYVCSNFSVEALREGLDYFLSNASARQRAGKAALRSMQKFEREAIGKQWSTLLSLR